MRITSALVLLILFSVGIVFLQIFLSKREGKLPGLVLPVIAFLFSLIYPLNMAAFTSMSSSEGVAAGFVFQMLLVWLLANIPTIILLAIFFACREKRRRNKQIDKMNVQDLN